MYTSSVFCIVFFNQFNNISKQTFPDIPKRTDYTDCCIIAAPSGQAKNKAHCYPTHIMPSQKCAQNTHFLIFFLNYTVRSAVKSFAHHAANTSTYLGCSRYPWRGKEGAKRGPSGAIPGGQGPAPAPAPGAARRVPGPFHQRPGAPGAAPLPLCQHIPTRRAARPRGRREGKEGERERRAALSRAATCRAAAAQGEVEAGRGAQHSAAGSGGAGRHSPARPAGAAAAEPRGRGCGGSAGGDAGAAAIFPPRHSNPAPPRPPGWRPRAGSREWAAAGKRRSRSKPGTSARHRRVRVVSVKTPVFAYVALRTCCTRAVPVKGWDN